MCWKSEHLHYAFHVIFIEKELVTPPLNGLILPGITRASILELSREWNEFRVSERDVPMAEIIHLLSEKRVS
jgi:branched-chain amino acid aminotransferase